MKLEICDLRKDFGKFSAVDGVCCTMENGVYGLLGVNGAGKTTLMRMLCTLTKPTGGSILWDGEDIFKMDMRYRQILGYLPQEFGFYPDFSAQDYLMYVASLKGLRPATAKKRVKELLHKVGLYQVRNKKMKQFSGGMKRRAGIAQAMLNDPKILILDEPTAGLDPNERIRFRNLISELAQDRLVLLSTHIVSDVAYIARELFLMKDGKIVIAGTADEILSNAPIKVYGCTVSRSEAEKMMEKYQVANLKTVNSGVELRVLANHVPCFDAQELEPTLEDIFLFYFGEKVEDEDAVF